MNTEKLLEERGKQYGSFKIQAMAIASIMSELRDVKHQYGEKPEYISLSDVENFFLVLKLVRMQTATDRDSLDDLIGYATLIRDRRFGEC